MRRFLALAALVVPGLAAAQTPYHLFVHQEQFTLYKPIHLYQCLDDTLTARPLQLDSGQVVTLKAYANHHWWVLSQYISHTPVDFYVRDIGRVLLPYQRPVPPPTHRRKWLH
jgi:hypothetical protein